MIGHRQPTVGASSRSAQLFEGVAVCGFPVGRPASLAPPPTCPEWTVSQLLSICQGGRSCRDDRCLHPSHRFFFSSGLESGLERSF